MIGPVQKKDEAESSDNGSVPCCFEGDGWTSESARNQGAIDMRPWYLLVKSGYKRVNLTSNEMISPGEGLKKVEIRSKEAHPHSTRVYKTYR